MLRITKEYRKATLQFKDGKFTSTLLCPCPCKFNLYICLFFVELKTIDIEMLTNDRQQIFFSTTKYGGGSVDTSIFFLHCLEMFLLHIL